MQDHDVINIEDVFVLLDDSNCCVVIVPAYVNSNIRSRALGKLIIVVKKAEVNECSKLLGEGALVLLSKYVWVWAKLVELI